MSPTFSRSRRRSNVSPDEIRQACATIVDVLERPLHKVLAAALGQPVRQVPLLRESTMSTQTTQPLSLLHVDF